MMAGNGYSLVQTPHQVEMLYNKSTTNPQQVEMLYNKSTTNRISGVWLLWGPTLLSSLIIDYAHWLSGVSSGEIINCKCLQVSFRAFWPNCTSNLCQDERAVLPAKHITVQSHNEYQSNRAMNRNDRKMSHRAKCLHWNNARQYHRLQTDLLSMPSWSLCCPWHHRSCSPISLPGLVFMVLSSSLQVVQIIPFIS